jgi:hypothetical protein
VRSNAAQITGIAGVAAVTVAGGEYSIGCNDSFTNQRGEIVNGQNVCVRHKASSESGTTVGTTLTVGGVSDTFTSSTQAAANTNPTLDSTPDAFSFSTRSDVVTGASVVSNAVTLTGLNTSATISVSNGEYSVSCASTGFTAQAGTVNNGDSVCVRHTAANQAGASMSTTLTIGGVSGVFISTTASSSPAPNPPANSGGGGGGGAFNVAALLFLAALVFTSQTRAADSSLSSILRVKVQALLNAVHHGDRATWETLTAPDFIYVEEGELQTRAEFLATIKGDDGVEPLKIHSFEARRSGDTAFVVHRDDVPDEGPQSRSAGQYLMTETWQLLGGEWKLQVVHLEAIRTDPPALVLTSTQTDERVGTYRRGSEVYTLRRDGDRIFGQRTGGPEREHKAETRDVLFIPGDTRIRKVFQRDAQGRVTSFVRRDENSDIAWMRADRK